jgi:hypothetical protein
LEGVEHEVELKGTQDLKVMGVYGGESGWLYYGYWCSIYVQSPTKATYLHRVKAIFQATDLIREITRVFELLFADLIKAGLKSEISKTAVKRFSRKDLRMLKQLAAIVASVADYTSIADAEFDLKLFAEIEKNANMEQRRSKLFRAKDTFADAEADAIRELEAKESLWLNFSVVLLTIVSLVGVTAAIVDAWDDGLRLFAGDAPLLWAALLGFPGLVGLSYLIAFKMFRS